MLFQQLGGFLLGTAFMEAVLLRYSGDVNIWKLVQATILIVDIAILYALWDALSQQGRLQPSKLRGEDWGCVAITGFVTIVRSLFITGLGLR